MQQLLFINRPFVFPDFHYFKTLCGSYKVQSPKETDRSGDYRSAIGFCSFELTSSELYYITDSKASTVTEASHMFVMG